LDVITIYLKETGCVWNGFIWLKIGYGPSGIIQSGEFDELRDC